MVFRRLHSMLRGGSLRWRLAVLSLLILPGLLLTAWLAFLALDHLFPFPVRALSPPAASVVVDARGEPLRFFLPRDGQWRFPIALNDAAPTLRTVLLASEDRLFRYHAGINPFSLLRAAWTNLRAGRVVCGGSTITMQLARLADPRPRTLASKCVEAFRAVQLEWHYSKDELFTLYMNLTPYGRNICGLGAAAWFYFGKTPGTLSLGEAALLAVLPRAPSRYDPIRQPAAARAARDGLLDRLAAQGLFSPDEIAAARRHRLPGALHKAPWLAPHCCELAMERSGRSPGGGEALLRIRTTLDARMQRTVEQKLAERATWLREQGLENAAVVVIDVATRELKALAGSIEYLDRAHHGMINAALTPRSPGSALKPLLYAKAIDAGLIAPQSLLLDLPTDYAGYVARNFDGQYRGQVTVEEALIHSLNAPAVRLLAELGLDAFFSLLRRAGLRTLAKPPGHYGLPLILGGCEVTLLDLTNSYATLAAGGKYREVRIQADDPPPGQAEHNGARSGNRAAELGETLLSPEACYLVAQMLSRVERPDLPQAWQLTRDMPAVAWKTGTSFGHRDAWAVGFSARYAIGVWAGNLDGKGVNGISGARHAGPLLFDLFRALDRSGTDLPRPDGLDIATIEVCAESRHLPGPFCPELMTMDYLPGRTRLPVDTLFRQVFLDSETGLRLEGACLERRPHIATVVREYPVELVAWWRSQGQVVRELPPLSPHCAALPDAAGLKIVSPSSRTPYRIRRDAPGQFQRIALVAQASADARELQWFQDGLLVATGQPGAPLFLDPTPGRHRLLVQDDQGRTDALHFSVE